MKNLRKLLAVIVAIALMATLVMVPAFADTLTDAEICEDLGMLQGAGDGVTDEYLATSPTRIQAAIMFLRLQGLEEEALAYEGTDNFSDAGLVWAGGQAILAYLKANPELGWVGVGDGSFDPLATIDAKSYAKVMLEALGFKQGEDFEWADVEAFAAEKGLTVAEGDFTVNVLAAATVEALKAETKAGGTLIEALVAAGVVTEAAAEATGLVETAVTASVAATGASKITVTFNKAVDDTAATFAVKKGSFTSNVKEVSFAADKKSAVIELATKMTEGTYTVTVGGLGDALTGSVTVGNEKVAKIEFVSDKAPLSRANSQNITASYKVYNQYGEEVTGQSFYTLTATAGKGTAVANAGTVTITVNAPAEFTLDEKVSLSIIEASSSTYVSTVMTVSAKAQVAEVAITSLYNEDAETLDVGSTPGDFKLVIEAKDQYGNDMTTAADVKDDIIVTVSNTAVANVLGGANNPSIGTTVIDDATKVTLPLDGVLAAGTTKVTIISKTTGKLASFDVVVKEAIKVDVLTLSAPAIAVAGEDIEIPFAAVDQFGNAVTDVDALNDMSLAVTGVGNTAAFEKDYVNNKVKLLIKTIGAGEEGTYVLTAVTGTNKVVQLSFTVVEAAVPTVVAGIKDFTKVLAVNGTSDMGIGNIVVNDQYGRAYDIVAKSMLADADGKYRVTVATSASSKVSVSAAAYIDDTNVDVVTFTGVAKGSSTITLNLQKRGAAAGSWTDVANSAYTFTAKTVEKADIASYEIADIGKVYADSDTTDTHGIDVVVNGVLVDGSKVAIPNNATYYTANLVNSNSANDLLFVLTGGTLKADKDIVVDVDTKETTATLIVTVNGANGAVVLTKTVTATTAALAITELRIEDGGATTVEDATNLVASAPVANINSADGVDTQVEAIVKAKDQYGVDMAHGGLTTIITNITDGKAITAIVAGDSFNVTAITSNGKVLTIKFIAK